MPRAVLLIFTCLLAAGCGRDRAEQAACRPAEPVQGRREPVRYAVLINGDRERRHQANIADAYGTLREIGFPQDRIFVLSTAHRREPLPAGALRFRPSPDEFERVMDRLAEGAQPGDVVLLYGTGHGDTSEEGESFLELRRGEIWALDLRDEMERLRSDNVIVMDQCFSGGFADAFEGTKSRALIVTTVDAKHPTDCSYFARAFWRSLRARASVRAAFAAALKEHQKALADDPELGSNGLCRSFNGLEDVSLN